MDENEIYEALGVMPPGQEAAAPDSPGTPQEGGAPEGSGAGTGGPAEETEEQADGSPEENVSDLDTSGTGSARPQGSEGAAQAIAGGGTEGSGKPGGASGLDQGANFPDAASRQDEIDRAVEAALAREREQEKGAWKDFFARAGLKNSFTGENITSKEEFDKWSEAFETAKLEQSLKEGKLTPEALDRAVAANPAVRRAEELLRQQEEDRQAREAAAFRQQVDRELEEIRKMDPGIRTVEDILKLETGGAFQEAVGRGHSFLDAFKLANFDRLQERRRAEAAQRAAQAARNSARSKEHLLPSGGKAGEASVAVPGDVMEVYRVMMPGASEAEIIAHYNRTLREMKMTR